MHSLVSSRPCDSKTMRHFIFLHSWIYLECVRVCERDNFFLKSKLMGSVLTAGPSAHSKSHKHFLSNSRTSSQVEAVLSDWWKFRFDSFNITNPEERKMWLAQGPGSTCGFLRITAGTFCWIFATVLLYFLHYVALKEAASIFMYPWF